MRRRSCARAISRRRSDGSSSAVAAIALAGLEGASNLTVADVGCGTGASALVLAHDLDAHIVGVDFLMEAIPEAGRCPRRVRESCWLDHYYRPLQRRFAAFLDRHHHSPAANDIVEAEQHEIDLYHRFSAFVSYGFYIATRTAD